jgi:hypothetical protein
VAALQRLASFGTSSEKLGEQRSVAGSVNAYGNTIGLNGSTPGAPGAPGATTTGATTPGPIEGDAQTRALAVRDGLIKRGMDFDTATAFAANALHESAANPNTGPGDRGASRGLFMWQGPRRQAYIEKYGHEPDNAPLDEQLDFVQHELGGSESLAQRRIAAAEGPEEKSRIVSRAYLRPKDEGPEMDRRGATARQLASLGPPQQPGAPGGGRVQVASVRPTQMEDGSPTPPTPGVQPPAQQQPGQQQTAATTPPVPQQPQQTPAATLPPQLQTNAAGLTPQDVAELKVMQSAARTPADLQRFQNEVQQRQVANRAAQQQWKTEQRQAEQDRIAAEKRVKDEEDRQRKIEEDRQKALSAGRKEEADRLAAEAASSKVKFDQANALRDEATKITETFRPVQESYERLGVAAKLKNAQGDLALIYTYTRMLDPATVHEEEVKRGMQSGGYLAYLNGLYAKVTNGELLPQDVRDKFLDAGRQFYDVRRKGYDLELGAYRKLAERFGLDPDTVAVSLARDQPAAKPTEPADKPPASKPANRPPLSSFEG